MPNSSLLSKLIRNNWGVMLLVLLSVYDFQLVGTPSFTKPQFLIGLLGIVCYIIKKIKCKGVEHFLTYGYVIFFICLISAVINFRVDLFVFQHYILILFIYLFGWYFIVYIAKCRGIDINGIYFFIVVAVLINNLIASTGLFFRPFYDFFISIQANSLYLDDARLYGIGTSGSNFGGGVTSGVGMILLVYLYCKKFIGKNLTIFLFLFIFCSGILIARTTMVCAIFAFFLYIWIENNIIKTIKILIPIAVSLFAAYLYFLSMFGDTYLFEHTFALFINYQDSGQFTDNSMKHMYEFYEVWPNNLKTWIIGDHKLTDGDRYYMDIDIGYIRSVFNYGLCGTLLCYLLLFSKTVLSVSIRDDLFKLFVVFFLFIAVINLKGMSDSLYYVFWIPFIYKTLPIRTMMRY